MPGRTKVDKIIYGISPYWKNDVKIRHPNNAMCGDYSDKQDLSVAYSLYVHNNANSAHMTIVFNVFVVYTLFNQVNCRVIDDSLNILVRIGNNFFFPIIIFGELILQIILIEVGSDAFKCTERGITGIQWLICIGFSSITFVLSIIIKFIPVDSFIQRILDNFTRENKIAGEEDLIKKDKNDENEEEKNNNKEEKNNKNGDKNELNNSINSKISKNTKVDNSKEDDPNGSLIKALGKNSDINSDGGSLRQQKPAIIVSYD